MKRLTLILLTALTLFAIGCSGNSYQHPKVKAVENKFTINKSYDDIWQGLVNWFATHNSPIKNIDKGSGLITTDYNLSVQDRYKYVDCGSLEDGDFVSADFGECVGNFNVLVAKVDDNSTKITINCFFKSTINQYNNKHELVMTEKIDCLSNGILEKEIYSAIR